MTWLVTGGAGYIGSHVTRALLAVGERVAVFDDLSSGDRQRVPAGVPLVVASMISRAAIRSAMLEHAVTGVVHLAARKSVEESVADPLLYYRQNVTGFQALLEAMDSAAVQRLVFSSSAAVYGTPETLAVDEDAPTRPENPYGRTKLACEWMAHDAAASLGLSVVSLRYFNVVGCAEPALEDIHGANLFPQVIKRLAEGRPPTVFGGDYPTPDGTCVRDYVHVQDLAEAHVKAARLTARPGFSEVVNVGCGRGYSVLDVMSAFEAALGIPLRPVIGPRRAGDPSSVVAVAHKAERLLGWRARFGLEDMVGSTVQAALPRVPTARPAGTGQLREETPCTSR